MEQDKLKAVLEYLTKQFQEQQKTSPTKPIQSKQPTHNQQQANNKIQISHFDQSQPFKGRLSEIIIIFFFFEIVKFKSVLVTLSPRVADVRPHILCCLITNVDLLTEGNLKKFLNLQVRQKRKSRLELTFNDLE